MQPADYADPIEARIALKSLVEKHERMAAMKVLAQQPNSLIENIYDENVIYEHGEYDVKEFVDKVDREFDTRKKAGIIS